MNIGGNQVDYWKIYLERNGCSLSISKSTALPLVLLKCWENMEQTTMVLTQEEAETVAAALLKTAGAADRERLTKDIIEKNQNKAKEKNDVEQ